MKYKNTPMVVGISLALSSFINPAPLYAQVEQLLEEVIVTGTRSQKARSVSDSPVPVDVLSGEDFNSQGNSIDITDGLRSMVPSYTATPLSGSPTSTTERRNLRQADFSARYLTGPVSYTGQW